MKIVVMMPTYNERDNIEKMIPILETDVFPRIKKNDMYILVADDTSPDNTQEIVEKYMKQWGNISLLTGPKEGLGAAYIKAMKYAMNEIKADAVIEFDADFQHDPYDIPRLVAAFDEGYDYVIGSRYIKGGAIPKEWGINRKILSVFGNLFTRIVWLNFSIHDMTSGFKLSRSSYLKKVNLDHLLSKQFAYKLHILHDMVKLGAKVKEIPIVFRERSKGASKISQKDQIDSLYVVLRLRLQDSARLIKFLTVGSTGFIVQLLLQELFARSVFVSVRPDSFRDGLAAAVGAEAAIISNFLFNNYWTFADTKHIKQSSRFVAKLAKFNIASIASIFIQFAAIFIFVHFLGENINIAGFTIKTRILILFPTIIFIVIPLNYLIYNKLIWKTQNLKKG